MLNNVDSKFFVGDGCWFFLCEFCEGLVTLETVVRMFSLFNDYDCAVQ